MRAHVLILGVALILGLALTACGQEAPTPTPTPTATATKVPATPTATRVAPTPTAAAAPTVTPVPPTPTATATATRVPPTPSTVVVKVANNARLGTDIITDAAGRTLYARDDETSTNITCTGTCLNNWPPFTPPTGAIGAGPNVTAKLDVLTRTDGTKQVTLNDQPLYYFVRDAAAGDVNGAGLGRFYTRRPDGTKIAISVQPTPTPTVAGGPTPTPTKAPATPTPTKAPAVATPTAFQVTIKNITLLDVTIPVGTTLTWANGDTVPHILGSGKDGKFDTAGWKSPTLNAGGSYSQTFSSTGTFAYTCSIHPTLNATVTVAQPGTPPSSTPASSGGTSGGGGGSDYY